MRPGVHFIASVSIGGGFWYLTRSLPLGMVCFLAGFVIDVDHIIEYMINFGCRGLTLKKVYDACEKMGRQKTASGFKRLYIVFHLVELAILLWAIYIYTGNLYILALALGYSSHLLIDCVGNPLHPLSYFMSWRAIKLFDPDRLFLSR